MSIPLSVASSTRIAKPSSPGEKSGRANEAVRPVFVRAGSSEAAPSRDRMNASGAPEVPGRFVTGAMNSIQSVAGHMGPQSAVPAFFSWQPSNGGMKQFGMMSRNNGHTTITGLEGDGPFVRFNNGQPSTAEVTNRQELHDVLQGAQRALPPLRSRL